LVIGAGGLIASASLLIMIYLRVRFASLRFAVCAILALLHDVFVLTGVYSILGRVFNLPIGEINTLFVTAALTVIGFSVHDTIVRGTYSSIFHASPLLVGGRRLAQR